MKPTGNISTKKMLVAGLALCAAATCQTWQSEQPLPAPGARYGNSAVTGPDGRIYVIGGYSLSPFKPIFLPSNTISRYDHGTWVANFTNINTARAYHASVVGCDGRIVTMGGIDVNEKALSSVEAYDVSTGQRSDLAPMVNSHAHLSASVGADCKIYAVSNNGDPNTGTNQVEVFDGSAWTTATVPNSLATIYGMVTSHNGRVYALGLETQFELDSTSASPVWQEVTVPSNGFSGPGYVSGNLYPNATATLGVDGKIKVLDESYLYSVQLPSWSFPDPASKPFQHKPFAATTAEGRVFNPGGADSDTSMSSYGPMKAVMGPYQAWWNFTGNTSVPTYACFLANYGAMNRTAGHVGQWAASLTGSIGFKAPADCTDIGAGDFSIEFWMKHDGSAAPFAVQSILDKRVNSNGYRGYHVYFYNNLGDQGGTIGLQMANGGYTNYGSNVPVPKNQWTHVAITVNRVSGGAIWINGVLATSFKPLGGSLTSTAQLNIGGHNFSSAFFKGQLDEMTIYPRALTFPEVRSLVLAGSQGKQ